ncbi:MAG: histidinol-phosphate transaminase [Candidatus Omnitrophota bacterium]
MSLARKNIENIVPYIGGKPIEETKRELGLRSIVKLASNENPLGACPRAIEAVINSLTKINRYPDGNCFYLKKKLAKSTNVQPANIIFGNGSDELIDIIIKAFVEEDENIISSETTFLEYEIISKVNNRKFISVPLKYFKYDLEAIRKKIDKKTKLIFIANPNNPTGTYVTKYELRDFLKTLPDNVILVVDEAYNAFIDVDDFPNTLEYVGNKNLIILRTFSKAYGLAGLRIGYAISSEDIISPMEKARQPFNVNLLAQEAALASIDDKDFIRKTKEVILEGKNYLYDALTKMGLVYVPSVANFILINVERDCGVFFRQMLKYGVIIRDMKQYGLNNFIRVTIGTKKENERFIKVLKKVYS